MARANTLALSHMFVVFVIFLRCTISELKVPENNAQFVGVNGANFVLDGKPFLFNGFNAYWLMSVATEPNDRHKVTEVFKDAFAAGLSICRTWAFNDGAYNALQISPGHYDEHTFQALDFVISEAGKHQIRLVLSLVNNWKEYGGKPQYIQWAQNAGEHIENGTDDFFTNALIKEYYKNHVKKIVTRVNTMTGITYGNDSTIMAWELMNEPRCEVDFSGKTINGWVQEMAPFVKSLDNKHLLEVGMEGFYGDLLEDRKQYNPDAQVFGTDFITNDLIPEIDFATIHAYPYLWLYKHRDNIHLPWMEKWMTTHWQDSRTILKKPLVLSEFGLSSKRKGYSLMERDRFLSIVYQTTYDLAKQGGTMAGSLVWQLMAEGMETYYDGSEIVLSKTPSTTEIIVQQSKAMTALSHLVTI